MAIDTEPLGPIMSFTKKAVSPHHRAPARFVPPHGAIIEGHVKVTVVIHVLVNFTCEPSANRMNTDGLGTGHLAHDINIVHAAIDDGRD
jgi:hypothetical protein